MTRNKWADQCAEKWLCGVGEPPSDLERTNSTNRRSSTHEDEETTVQREVGGTQLERWPEGEESEIPALVESSSDTILIIF